MPSLLRPPMTGLAADGDGLGLGLRERSGWGRRGLPGFHCQPRALCCVLCRRGSGRFRIAASGGVLASGDHHG